MNRKLLIMMSCVLCLWLMSGCGQTARDPVEEPGGANDQRAEREEPMELWIGETRTEVQWEDNDAVSALRDLVSREPVIIETEQYGGWEQVGAIGSRLPRNDEQTTAVPGDIMLYSGDQIVLFYGDNSWAYTSLGHITDPDETGLRQLLSADRCTIRICISE